MMSQNVVHCRNQVGMNGDTLSIKAPKQCSKKFAATSTRKFFARRNVFRIFLKRILECFYRCRHASYSDVKHRPLPGVLFCKMDFTDSTIFDLESWPLSTGLLKSIAHVPKLEPPKHVPNLLVHQNCEFCRKGTPRLQLPMPADDW